MLPNSLNSDVNVQISEVAESLDGYQVSGTETMGDREQASVRRGG